MIMKSKQVVLITGSSTGFGRLFTETLARKGHTVFATMRDPGGRNAKNASEIRALAEKDRSEEHTSELQSPMYLVCRLLLEKKKKTQDSPAYNTHCEEAKRRKERSRC